MRSGMTLLRWDYASSVLSRCVVQVLRLGWIPWRHNCNSGSQRNRATRRSFNRPRVRRHEFDMTQAEFAERIGISQNYLSTMGRGKVEIGAEILLRISRKFVKSVEWLLTGEA